jgi:hypothetical protein
MLGERGFFQKKGIFIKASTKGELAFQKHLGLQGVLLRLKLNNSNA